MLAEQKPEDRVAKRVVHHAVQLPAQQIPAAHAVSRFVGGVFPHFAEHHGVFVLRFRGAVQAVNKAVRQLVGNV